MAVDSFARRLAAAAIQKGGSDVTKEYVDAELDKKYDKTGGAITGDVAITGDLTVSGTTTTEKEKQLLVEDNVIVTNANKIDLKTLLSGLAINKNENATYGIMYDPTDDTVKFGEGTIGENNKFIFKDGEGLPLAIRADSNQFVDGCLVKWDASTNSFVKSDLTDENVGKKIDKIDFSNGQATVTFDTADGMTLVGTGQLTYADKSTGQIGTDIEVPIIPGDGVIMDATTSANHVTVKVDPEHSVYMAATPTAENAIPMYTKSSKSWIGLPSTPSATASSVATRDANGRMQVGAPAVGGDIANKAYVDSQTPKIGTTTNKNNLTDIEYLGETDIPATPEAGKEYAVTDLISYSDLDSDLQGKLDATVTKAYVDAAVSNKQDALSAGTGIDITDSTIKITDKVARLESDTPASYSIPVYVGVGSIGWAETTSSTSATANTLVARTAKGIVRTAAPEADTDAANKKYVDDSIAIISIEGTAPITASIDENKKATIGVDDIVARLDKIPTTGGWIVPTYNVGTKSWKGELAYSGSATVSTYVVRGSDGVIVTGTPTADNHATTKKYVDDSVASKQGALTAGTGISLENDTIAVTKNVATIATLPELPADVIPYYSGDLATWNNKEMAVGSRGNTIALRTASGTLTVASPTSATDAATKAYVDAAIVAEGPASTIVTLSAPDEAVNGTLTEDELSKLQASDNASIMFSHKKYDLGGKGHQEGYLTYTHAGYENNVHILESITITISTRAWVLNATEVMDEEEIKAAITPMIPAIPTWKTTAPTTEADKAKVQFTKVTIATTDETNFPGMNGRYTLVPGFTNDGFHYGTVVCSQVDPAYEFPFIGSITSEMASGTVIKPSVAPTYVSVVDPAVTFTYEYLW